METPGHGAPSVVAYRHEHGVHAVSRWLTVVAVGEQLGEDDSHAAVARSVADVVLDGVVVRCVHDELVGRRVVRRCRADRLHIGAVTGLGHREAAGQLAAT